MMSQNRFDALMSGMNSMARKVYDAVPQSEAWAVKRVHAELHRIGVGMEFKVCLGSLDTLRRAGLVYEPERGEFQREPIREKKTAQPETNSETVMKKSMPLPVPPTPPSPMDLIGALAERASRLMGDLKSLADDISDAAITIQQDVEQGGGAAKKVSELEAKLKAEIANHREYVSCNAVVVQRLEAELRSAQADRNKLAQFQAAFGALTKLAA